MRYPELLKKGDTIGICAPSDGIIDPEKIARLDAAIDNLKNMGYKVIETESVRKSISGRSASSKKRAEEFMSLLENDDVKLIITATGGDFLIEIFDYLDLNKIKKLKPKWIQGYSNITVIEFIFNNMLDISSMYCQTVKDYAIKPIFKSLEDSLKIMSGEKVIQNSFEKFEKEWKNTYTDIFEGYNLTEEVVWKNLNGESKIEFEGRSIGGCFDDIINLIGTKYDNVKSYIKKYKEDGIIWFLEIFEMTTPEITRNLIQMKNAGYFENCKGIIFGRPLFVKEDYNITYSEAIKVGIGDLNIPVIIDADIGHVSPQLAVVNGAILKITSENGKGKIDTYLK